MYVSRSVQAAALKFGECLEAVRDIKRTKEEPGLVDLTEVGDCTYPDIERAAKNACSSSMRLAGINFQLEPETANMSILNQTWTSYNVKFQLEPETAIMSILNQTWTSYNVNEMVGSMSLSSIAVVAGIVGVLFLYVLHIRSYHEFSKSGLRPPKGSFGWPIIGETFSMNRDCEAWASARIKRYCELVVILEGEVYKNATFFLQN